MNWLFISAFCIIPITLLRFCHCKDCNVSTNLSMDRNGNPYLVIRANSKNCSRDISTKLDEFRSKEGIEKLFIRLITSDEVKWIVKLVPSDLTNFTNLKELELENVELTFDQDDQNWPPSLKTLILDENSKANLSSINNSKIETLKIHRFEQKSDFDHLDLPNVKLKLKSLELNRCDGYNLTSLLTGLTDLQSLEVEDKHERISRGGILPELPSLSYIKIISINNVPELPPHFFNGTKNLSHVTCQQINLSKDAFSREQLQKIVDLNLHDASITTDEFSGMVKSLHDIRTLDITHNNIKSIKLTSSILRTLRDLKNLKDLKLFKGNDYANLSCSMASDIQVLNNTLTLDILPLDILEKINDCEKNSSNKLAMATSTSAAVILALIILISIVIYKFRYWFYSNPVLSRCFSSDDDPEASFEFDAFLTFNESDRLIMESIKDKLTNGHYNRKFRIATHDTDFLPGNLIEENMRMCIEKSRRVICIMSKDFLESEYCQQELKLMMGNVHKVIVILLDPTILKESTNVQLTQYFRTHTYLDYDNGSDRFWKRLIYSLPHRRRTKSTSRATNDQPQQTELLQLA